MTTKCGPADDNIALEALRTRDDADPDVSEAVGWGIGFIESVEPTRGISLIKPEPILYAKPRHRPTARAAEIATLTNRAAIDQYNLVVHEYNRVVQQLAGDLASAAAEAVAVFRRHLPRNELLEVVDPALPARVLQALRDSTTDFRTVSSLADELGVSEEAVQHELDDLGDAVRRPLGQETRYPDWYRLTEKGPTRQEKMARLKAMITFSSMDDDF